MTDNKDILVRFEQLRSGDDGVRNTIRLELREKAQKIADDATIQAIVALLQDQNAKIRSRAARVLGMIGLVSTEDALISRLQAERDWDVRVDFVLALGNIRSVKALDVLIPILLSKVRDFVEREERWIIAEALGYIAGEIATNALIQALTFDYGGLYSETDIREAAMESLVEINGDRVVDALISILNQENVHHEGLVELQIRMLIIHALGEMKSDRAIKTILNFASHEEDSLREVAANVLRNFKSPEVLQVLQSLLNDPDEYVRKYALNSIRVIEG
jgi:HEAT repeat protein